MSSSPVIITIGCDTNGTVSSSTTRDVNSIADVVYSNAKHDDVFAEDIGNDDDSKTDRNGAGDSSSSSTSEPSNMDVDESPSKEQSSSTSASLLDTPAHGNPDDATTHPFFLYYILILIHHFRPHSTRGLERNGNDIRW